MDTWKVKSEALGDVSPKTKEVLRRATTTVRVYQRVEAAFRAAFTWVRDNVPGGGTLEGFYATSLCWLEGKGLYGGGPSCPGAGTLRHPAFRGLGSGRRQANDGHVWTAAIMAAATSWLVAFPDHNHSLEWGTQDGDLAVSLFDGKGQVVHSVTLPALLGSEPEALKNAVLHAAREVYPNAERWDKLAPAIGHTLDVARELLAEQK